MARVPRNQLLFALLREREHWPIKLLREKTQQLELYINGLLSEIATPHRSGGFDGTRELMPAFKDHGVRGFFVFAFFVLRKLIVYVFVKPRWKTCHSCMRRSRLVRTSRWMTMVRKRRAMMTMEEVME